MAIGVRVKHPEHGISKTAFVGFSWTSFFFNGIPAMTRGDVGIGLGVIVGTIFLGALSFGLLVIVINLIWAFVYNKMYTTKLLEKGYQIDETDDRAQAVKSALGIA